MSSLFVAARTGCVDDIESSISAGADVNAKDGIGHTPLVVGFYSGHVGIVKALISAGADIEIKGILGFTLLHMSVGYRHIDMAKIFIAAGADVNAKGAFGITPLMISASAGRMDTLKLLITAGADVNAIGPFGCTSLYASAKYGHMGIAKVLITAGADVNVMGVFGETALYASAANGHMCIVKLLIAAGAEVNTMGVFGNSPLYASAEKGHMGIAKLLIAAGAKADLTTANYKSLEKEVGQTLIKYLLLYEYRSITKSKEVKNSFVRSKMWNECKKQVKEMGETRLGDSSTSFIMFMTETDKNKLASYLSKKKFGIKSKRGKISYMKKFPMYLEDIETQFKIGNERACLLLKSQKLLRHCFCCKLPPEAIGKISEFMTNEDIQRFLTMNNSLK